MNADTLNKWLTLGANLGVLSGIILVAYEINQATVTTRAEMVSDYQDRWVAMDLSWQSQDLARAWAKAIENPDDLTVTEMVQLSGLLWSYLDHISTNRVLWELGVFEDPLDSHDQVITANAELFFGNKFAQAWWLENRNDLHPLTVELMDREIKKVSTDDNLDYYKRVKARMNE